MSLQDRIDEEIKSGKSGDLMTPEEREYFSTLDGKEEEEFMRKILERKEEFSN